jgi:hypothetical protein
VRRAAFGLALVIVVAAVSAVPIRWGALAWAVTGQATGAQSPGGVDTVLSDERTFTRWAHTAHGSGIHAQPNASSKRLAKLRDFTEDGYPEVYLALASHRDNQGREWIEVRIPMRPNGRVGWVPRQALGGFHETNELLVVNRSTLRISLYVRGRLRWRAPVGVGGPNTPTPAGRFWIRERFKVSDPASPYAPYAFGTAAYSTLTEWPGGGIVGIHGDFHQPQLIPGRPSHGCIRLRKADDAWLAHHAGVGTPLRII